MFVELLNKGCELFKILFVVYYIITVFTCLSCTPDSLICVNLCFYCDGDQPVSLKQVISELFAQERLPGTTYNN